MSAMGSQITGVSIVYWTLCSGADQRKHQSSASQDFVRGIHRWPVNSRHKGPVTQKMLPFDDVIMMCPCVHFHAHLLFCPYTHILLISKNIVMQRLQAGRCLFLVKLCAIHCTSNTASIIFLVFLYAETRPSRMLGAFCCTVLPMDISQKYDHVPWPDRTVGNYFPMYGWKHALRCESAVRLLI